MKKRVFAVLTALVLLCACLPLGAVSVSAATFGDLTYEITDGKVTITDCNENVTSVEIPATIEGYPVTTIGNYAFFSCDDLQSVTIPDSVTTIGKLAFDACDSLTSVTIPDSVTTIGEGAFSNCTSLTEVTIPSSVTSIGGAAFKGTSLKTVYYDGDKTDRAIIAVGSNNEPLQNAVWHYEYADKGEKNNEEVPSAKEGFHWWMVVAIVSLITNAVLLFLLLKKKKSAE